MIVISKNKFSRISRISHAFAIKMRNDCHQSSPCLPTMSYSFFRFYLVSSLK